MIMNISPKYLLVVCDSWYCIKTHERIGVVDFGEVIIAVRVSLRVE